MRERSSQGWLCCLLWIVIGLSIPPAAAQVPCPPALAGDVDNNGVITPGDARQAFRYFLQVEPPDECRQARADVSDPQAPPFITPVDISCIWQRFLGLPSCLDPIIANAGADQFVSRPPGGSFTSVTLNGRGSVSRRGLTVDFLWGFTGVPAASMLTNANLSDATAVMPQFTPDAVGFYTLNLNVTDALDTAAQDGVMVNAQEPIGHNREACECEGEPGVVIDMSSRVTDDSGAGIPLWPVTFTEVVGDGTFVIGQTLAAANAVSPLTSVSGPGCRAVGRDLEGRVTTVVCFTNTAGIATASLQLEEGLHIVVARAQDVPMPVFFCIGLDDRDGDCVADAVETALGLMVDNPDSDGDGIGDGLEDSDNDGLSNIGELVVGTDPAVPDTDGDGVLDGDEDADSDQLPNGQEIDRLGTNPLRPDTDGDGVADSDEVRLGVNPTDAAERPALQLRLRSAPVAYVNDAFRVADTDGDGVADRDEMALETNPNDAADRPLLRLRPRSAPVAYVNDAFRVADTDGDGVADRDEVVLGTDPADAADRPLLRVRLVSATVFYHNDLP